MKLSKARTVFSVIWLVFTFSLVSWWFILNLMDSHSTVPISMAEMSQRNRMYFWEGSTLLMTVLAGGGLLIFLSRKEDQRNESLRFFFANFSHDIKTSISRLRLQGEILSEAANSGPGVYDQKIIKRLMADIAKLDLQLDNSLLLTHQSESQLLIQDLDFKSLIQSLQIEFEDLKIHFAGEVRILADSRAIKSVLRNLLENSKRHGQSDTISISAKTHGSSRVAISVKDNGQGSTVAASSLGDKMIPQTSKQGNGIGLYLCRQLIKKMKGQIIFKTESGQGFESEIILPGQIVKQGLA